MRGACLCGKVSFEAEPAERKAHACHCSMCRRWTGSAFIGVAVPEGDITFAPGAPVSVYGSSDWAERAWCGSCGSTLFYRVTAEGPSRGMHFVSLGLFETPDAFPLSSEIYIDRKPASYAFAGEHRRITQTEAEAAFASQTQ